LRRNGIQCATACFPTSSSVSAVANATAIAEDGRRRKRRRDTRERDGKDENGRIEKGEGERGAKKGG
jgi:hypothetical protein